MLLKKLSLFLFVSSFSIPGWAWQPIEWASSDIQLLYGGDFIFAEQDRVTVTVEHMHGWKYGTNYFFVDMFNNYGFEVYAEAYAYLSLRKISGEDVSLGPIKDFSLVGGLNISNRPETRNFKAYLFGISLDLANQYFDYLQLDITAYKDDSVHTYGVQITPVWSIPFELGPVKFKFRGFADIRDGNTNALGNVSILAQPQMLLDIGGMTGWKRDTVYIGMELSYWLNKFGVHGANESAWQGMIIGFF